MLLWRCDAAPGLLECHAKAARLAGAVVSILAPVSRPDPMRQKCTEMHWHPGPSATDGLHCAYDNTEQVG